MHLLQTHIYKYLYTWRGCLKIVCMMCINCEAVFLFSVNDSLTPEKDNIIIYIDDLDDKIPQKVWAFGMVILQRFNVKSLPDRWCEMSSICKRKCVNIEPAAARRIILIFFIASWTLHINI